MAGHIATEPGIHAVLASTVHNPDRRGVGVLATVDVLLAGESRIAFGPAVDRRAVCVRIAVVRRETGPRDVRPELIDCPPGTEIGE